MLQERAAGLGRGHALSAAHEQRRPQRLLHVSDARAGCGQREVCALRTARDAARLDYVGEQTEMGEVEAHGFPCWARALVLPSDSAKQTYVKYLLSAKSRRVIFAIDESSTAWRGGLPRAVTLVTNASAREDGVEQWPKSRHPLSGRSLPISSSTSRC